MPNRQLFIDGAWRDATEGRVLESVDPYKAEPWATVAHAGAEDVALAVAAARQAFDDGPWGRTTGRDRARLMRRLAELIERDADQLAHTEVHDNGKVIREAKGQMQSLPGYYDYFAGMADKITSDVLTTGYPLHDVYQLLEPIGVVGAISAWNSPLLIATYKLAPAFAAGCTVVLKPSEHTPMSALHLAALVQEAGFPPGVLNVVVGYGDVGAALAGDPRVDKVAFTGSTGTGIRVAQAAAEHLAPASLELGGKSANIVFADADLQAAVNGVIAGIFAASGQTCVAGSRLVVQRPIYEEMLEMLVARAKTIRLGDPMLPETEMGPLAFREHRDGVVSRIQDAVSEGAQLACGGHTPGNLAPGFFVEPTIFTGVHNSMRVAQEEIFGPVLAVIPFEDDEDAVQIANASPLGLAAGVWTGDVRRAHRLVHRLKVGTVWVNSYRLVSCDVPFGGRKMSGYGRENGPEGIREYLVTKSAWFEMSGATRDPFVLG